MLLAAAPASARFIHQYSTSFGEPGSGDGQLNQPQGIAVNESTHDVYVADEGNNRVEEFSSSGVYLGQFNGGAAPTGPLAAPTWIAIDNSTNPLDPSAGDVYVFDSGHNVIDKFTATGEYLGQLANGQGGYEYPTVKGIAVDPAGNVLIGVREHFYKLSSASPNVFLQEVNLYGGTTAGLAADGEGHLYLTGGFYESDHGSYFIFGGPELLFEKEQEIKGLPSDIAFEAPNDSIIVSVKEKESLSSTESISRILIYSKGQLIDDFGPEHLTAVSGIALDTPSHFIYAADAAAGRIVVFHGVVLPDVLTSPEPTFSEQEGSVTLEGTVDPDGEAVTGCRFEYGPEASYGSVIPCESAPGSGSSPVTVKARVSGLTRLSEYHYRLVAEDAHGSTAGADRAFTVPIKPELKGESVSSVSSDGASFHATINPGAAPTSYRFEYGTTAAYGSSAPVQAGDAGSGVEDVPVSARSQTLEPDTIYHYRIVVRNAVGEKTGPDLTFTTQTSGEISTLPDGRAWEMVSPPSKLGAQLSGISGFGSLQAAQAGDAIAYAANIPVELNSAGNRSPEAVQLRSKRTQSGVWQTEDLTAPHTEGPHLVSDDQEYPLFSSDLAAGIVDPIGSTPLPPLPAGSERTVYIRNAGGEYEPLITTANTPPGAKFGEIKEDVYLVNFIAANPDLSHVVLDAREETELTPGYNGGGLYIWSDGTLQLASVLPNGQPTHGSLGNVLGAGELIHHAISNEGTRLIFSAISREALYLRDTERGETVEVSAPQGVSGPAPPRTFAQYMAADGSDSRIFFLSPTRLTVDSTAPGEPSKPEDLYEYEVTSGANEPLAGKLTDLSVDPNAGELAQVRGVIGASEDGKYVYFVAAGVLGDGAARGAISGENNLYMEHYDDARESWGTPTFIARLSTGDAPDWTSQPKNQTARVSPNGRYVSFMSEGSLTGYENRDATSGVSDEEVFVFDAVANRLVCASCNPTGGRPAGRLDVKGEAPLVDPNAIWGDRWLAANLPGWNLPGYQSRYLTDNGRVFFDSSDALVPADVDGTEDVYEYEAAGVGSCQPPDYGQGASVVYDPSTGGCIGLVSAGTSPEESAFMDASESGGDVFFLTTSRLSALDFDTSRDVYDAHECTESSPCAPATALAPPPCSSGDACKPSPTPQPSIYGAPASQTFTGAGNVASTVPTAHKPTVRSHPKKAAQGRRKRALAACKRVPRTRRRACERRAVRSAAPGGHARRAGSTSRAGR